MPLQSLSLSQQQRQMMILAPQLRQSLEMLQLPLMELRAMIQQEMVSNPTIEDVTTPQEVSLEGAEAAARGTDGADGFSGEEAGAEAGSSHGEVEPLDFNRDIEALTELDREWRDYFLQDLQNNPYTQQDEERRQYMFDSLPQPQSLQGHLLEQLGLTELTPEEKQLGETIIGSINDDGYLTTALTDLAAQTVATPEQLERVLKVVQEFHPTGIGARDLRECLLLQVAHLGDTPQARLAEAIVADHLQALGAQRIGHLAQVLKVEAADIEAAAALIKTLNPLPGRLFSGGGAGYITPEIVVRKSEDGRWVVLLDDDQLPHIRISAHYRRLLEDAGTSAEVKSYIRERIRSGAFLIKSIYQRQKTIHRIASEIVAAQQDFLEHGLSRLHPMTMAEVAARVGVHETTVSRTVANKYMRTPVGVFELKYFFTPGLRTASGAAISNKTVQDRIDAMIKQEDTANPLSDQVVQERLRAEGIEIARRTVAKYRLILRIPPSHLRKRG
ncbi:MAG: RNA polymerase factor sigma-54 [Kiritimatiellae bacterium]|nr:RNA polymerase factor sigma-54 [Kiritimatiellia bacterium]